MKSLVGYVVVALIVLCILSGVFRLACRDGPNAQAINTARSAIELAREVNAQNTASAIWADRLRLLALVLGVSVPIVVVYLLWRHTDRSDPPAREVLAVAEERGLLRLPEPAESRDAQQFAMRMDDK